ncbi:hypothetical protein Golomagni_07755, partial [Golovinomyces magnicellulatus]
MDFASLMGKELSKKPKAEPSQKYLKRSEVEAQREAAYKEEQEKLQAERTAKAAAKRKLEEDAAAEAKIREEKRQRLAEESRTRREDQEWEEEQARRKRIGLPELEKPSKDDDSAAVSADDIPDEELLPKLREIGHPVTLFGESHLGRLRRYKKLTTVLTNGPIPTTLKLVDEKDMKVETVPKDKEGREFLFRQLASYFTMVLTAYDKTMRENQTGSNESKAAYSAMIQARDNMKPLFRKLEEGDIEESLLGPIVEIVKA